MDNKRHALINAARELFLKNAFDRISIRHIARHAGVNSALIAYYFGSKSGLFREMMSSFMRSHMDRMNQAFDSDKPLSLEDFFQRFYQNMPPEMARLLVRIVLFERSETRDWLLESITRPVLATIDRYAETLIEESGREVSTLAVRVLMQSLLVLPKLFQPILEELHPKAVDDAFFQELARLNADVLSTYFKRNPHS